MNKMQKRKDNGDKLDMLNGDGANAQRKRNMPKMSMTDLTMGMMATERIEELNIFDITPDQLQPRRAVPSAVRAHWNFDVTKNGMEILFDDWLALSAEEADIPYEDMALLVKSRVMSVDRDVDEDSELPVKNIGGSLIELASLAGNIKTNGLTNPISAYRNKDGYQIETGERRWLAYHLLNIVDIDNAGWSLIPARVMDDFSVWRQASENSTRSELNAISKARQLSLLLMDLYGPENFSSIQEFDHEQDYYAQVADGAVYRVPRGKGEQLVAAMGLQHPRQLRAYRRLLRVSKALWVAADDGNWTEFKIRNILDGRGNDADTVSAETVYGDIDTAEALSSDSNLATQHIEIITRDDVFKQATRLNANYESKDDELKALSDVLSVVRKRIKYLKAQGGEGTSDE